MRIRALTLVFVLTLMTGVVTALAPPAGADHTTPPGPLSSNTETTQTGLTFGLGGVPIPPVTSPFQHITNFPTNPGTDMILFNKKVGANTELYASNGTLGGGDEQHVGQRIIRLTSGGGNDVDPTWIADHGSANCGGTSTGNTGLQHDVATAGDFRRTSRRQSIPNRTVIVQLLLDATDSTGRCHDTGGGGLEIIDIADISQPREIHLTRHAGTTHTTTTDALRPWIVYSSNSSFSGQPWIDVLDTRTCLNLGTMTLAQKRAACRPKVFRIKFQDHWTYQRNFYNGNGAIDPTQGSSGCHDITAIGSRLYCAAIRATMILDVANLTDPVTGNIRGTQMPCPVIASTTTTAMITNCSGQGATAPTVDPSAFDFLGTVNHAGIDCTMPPLPRNSSCNSNLLVAVKDGITISHEADPTHDERIMFATDERGGGVVPPGSACDQAQATGIANGGIHAFDIRGATPGRPADPNFPQMLDPAGAKAVFIGAVRVPGANCTVHMIEHAHDEQRLFVAYYSQGTKVVDYFIHDQGTPGNLDDDRISFQETASFVLPGANTWMSHPFKTVNNPNGTRTYYLIANDIARGIDIMTYTAAPNPIGAEPPAATATATATIQAGNAGAGLLVLAAALPAAALLRRRRRSRS